MSGGGDRGGAPGADRARGAILGYMRHELRTPVNAILGYSEMLIEDAEDAGSASLTADLRRIHGAGHTLLALIDDIVRLSEGADKGEDEAPPSAVSTA